VQTIREETLWLVLAATVVRSHHCGSHFYRVFLPGDKANESRYLPEFGRSGNFRRTAVRWHGPAQMEGYLTYYYEYHFLYITGIEHVESKIFKAPHY
jgi:hypothetical protein